LEGLAFAEGPFEEKIPPPRLIKEVYLETLEVGFFHSPVNPLKSKFFGLFCVFADYIY
jgi:hypothetical protein